MFSTAFIFGMIVMQVVLTICAALFSPHKERLEMLGMLGVVAAGLWLIEAVAVVYHYSSTHTTGWLHMYAVTMVTVSFGFSLVIARHLHPKKIGNTPASIRR